MIIEFINRNEISELNKREEIIESFYKYAKNEKAVSIDKIVSEENLKADSTRFIEKSISKGYVEYGGAELDSLIPPTSRRAGAREAKKQSVLEKIRKIVEVFVGILCPFVRIQPN